MRNFLPPTMAPLTTCLVVVLAPPDAAGSQSVARIWNEQNLAAIRIDFPNPPVHARNLFHTSVAMWDAWAAYDELGVGFLHRESATAGDVAAARREAISYAAYRILAHRYARSVNAETSLAALEAQMLALGYDPGITGVEGGSASAVGNRVAATVLASAATDASNETLDYTDDSYSAVNPPLVLQLAGATMIDADRWQPLAFDVSLTQNGLVNSKIQIFIGSHWGSVRPFAMAMPAGGTVYHDPGPPPRLEEGSGGAYRNGNVEVLRHSAYLDPTSGETIDISPGARGANTLGFNDGSGHDANPATGLAYAPNIVPHGDYGRVVAEFWADGPDSETPPGHWNSLANSVADHPGFQRRFQGSGALLDALEWDVKTYFALNAALHDVAVAVWGCKRVYDYVRPISSIRYMGGWGQAQSASLPLYHPRGLPLVPDLIEQATVESLAPGGRHEGAPNARPGQVLIHAWGGEPQDPENQFTGTRWIRAIDWRPYQRDTFVTPAFAGYVSGHSGFSRAAAEVLTRITGSEFFPGGMAAFTASMNEYLEFELGPSVDVVLQWATYYDAADEAGISRIYGGIHVPADDGPGRIIGSKCGIGAWQVAEKYFDGSILDEKPAVTIEAAGGSAFEIKWAARRGLFYELQSSTSIEGPFERVGGAAVVAEDAAMNAVVPRPAGETMQFYQVRQLSAPSE